MLQEMAELNVFQQAGYKSANKIDCRVTFPKKRSAAADIQQSDDKSHIPPTADSLRMAVIQVLTNPTNYTGISINT